MKLTTKSKFGHLQSQEQHITDDTLKAETLNNLFASVFTKENMTNIPHQDAKHNNFLHGISIMPENVKEKVDELKKNKSAGSDGLHPQVLKELVEVLR